MTLPALPPFLQNAFTTVGQLFGQLGEREWWSHRTQGFKGAAHPGNDFGIPLRTPIASITSGRVVYAQRMNSDPTSAVGWIVQVEAADGSLMHYHHLYQSNVHVGDYIQAGQVLGLSGGCPQGAYGKSDCTRFDSYSNGPHIEVRYSPTYNPAKGNWQQDWQDPMPAILQYSGMSASLLGSLPFGSQLGGWSSDLRSSAAGATQRISVGNDFAQAISAGIGNGIRGGVEQIFADNLHPAADLSLRTLLVIAGSVGVFIAVLGLLAEGGRGRAEEALGPVVRESVKAEVGSQTAQAIVPPIGTKRRIKQLGGSRPSQAALPDAPAQAALPAPSNEPTQDELDAFVRAAEERRQRIYGQAGQVNPGMDKLTGGDGGAAEVFGIAKEHKPVELPIPKAAQAGAAGRQRHNKLRELGRQMKRADEAKAARKAARDARKGK